LLPIVLAQLCLDARVGSAAASSGHAQSGRAQIRPSSRPLSSVSANLTGPASIPPAKSASTPPAKSAASLRLSVFAGNGANTLSWTKVAASKGSPTRFGAVKYTVYRAASASGPFTTLPSKSIRGTTLIDPILIPGTYYYYVVARQGVLTIARSEVLANDTVRMSSAVGPGGSVLIAANGDIRVEFPSGAFEATIPVSVIEEPRGPEAPGSGILVAPYFRFEPDGLQLGAAAKVTMRYSIPVTHFQVADTMAQNVALVSYDEQLASWERMLTSVDTASRTFSGTMTHFSYWSGEVVQPHGTPPATANYCQGICHELQVSETEMSPLISTDKQVCYNCHGNTSSTTPPAGATGPNIQAEAFDCADQTFSGSKSRHPVPEGKLFCASCHNQHKNPAQYYKLLRAVDAVTGLPIESTKDNPYVGNAYCFACHGTQANLNVEASDPGYWTRTGESKTEIASTPHNAIAAPTTSGINCLGCHTDHASPNGALVRSSIGTRTVSGNDNTLCSACHDPIGSKPSTYSYRGIDAYDPTPHNQASHDPAQPLDGQRAGLCLNCHAPHGTSYPSGVKMLTAEREDNLCYGSGSGSCHTLATSSGPSVYSQYHANSDVRTHHDVRQEDQQASGSRVTCSNCHNPHVNTANKPYCDPDDLSQAIEPGPIAYVNSNGEAFALVGADHDAVPPVISGQEINFYTYGGTSPIFKWTTNEQATSWVDIGPTAAYELGSFGNNNLVTSHAVTVSGLTEGNVYHYRIRTADALGNETTTTDSTFAAVTPPPTPTLVPEPDQDSPDGNVISVTFDWSAVACPDGHATQYYVYATDGWNTYQSGWINTNIWTASIWPGTIAWKVRARDSVHTASVSAWSGEDVFVITSPSGSCPFLFTWDGEKFAFEADLYGPGKLGTKTSSGYLKPNPNDYYLLANTPVQKDGSLELRLVEERFETDYLDKLALYTVDVPEGKELYAEKPQAESTFTALAPVLHTVERPLSNPLSAMHLQTGSEVSAKIASSDGDYLVLNEDRNNFTYQTIELDLGDLSAAGQKKFVMDAVSMFPTTKEGVALASTYGARTKLEVPDADGRWVAVPKDKAVLPKPPEFSRPYVFDVSGIFPTDDYRVRMTFLFKTYIDSVYFDTSTDETVTITEVPLTSAELASHGLDPKSCEEEIYDYLYSAGDGRGLYLPGAYTRFGEVSPLLSATDDKFVVYGGGDELRLRFDQPAASPEGTSRRFLIYTNGYYKDLKTDVTKTVEPLPFAAMSNFPYDETVEHYPDDEEHTQYLAEWNTRNEEGTLPEGNLSAKKNSFRFNVSAGFFSAGSNFDYASYYLRPLLVPLAPHYSVNTDLIRLRFTSSQDASNDASLTAGWENEGTAPTPSTPGSPVDGGTLDRAKTSDGTYWITGLATADHRYNWQMVKFTVNPTVIGSARLMTLEWRGHGEPTAGYPTKLYIWNFQTSSWEQKVSEVIGTDQTRSWQWKRATSSFCLKCHDGSPPSGVTVPSSIENIAAYWNSASGDFHGAGSGSGFGGTLKAPYSRSYPAIPCDECHVTHGNGNLYHLRSTINGTSGIVVRNGNEVKAVCSACHNGDSSVWHATCLQCHNDWGGGCGYGYIDSPEVSGFYNYPADWSNCLLCHNHGSRSYVNSDYGRGVQDADASDCGGCHTFPRSF